MLKSQNTPLNLTPQNVNLDTKALNASSILIRGLYDIRHDGVGRNIHIKKAISDRKSCTNYRQACVTQPVQ